MSLRKKIIRDNFRDSVFGRDGHKCKFCDRRDHLDAHHITDRNEMPNGGYVKENGITLCPEHHEIAEMFHESCGQLVVPGFTPEELYEKIGSSKQLAIESSMKLR